MTKFSHQLLIFIGLVSSFFTSSTVIVQAQNLISQSNNSESIIVNGRSGGTDLHQGCGYLNLNPNYRINLDNDNTFMNIAVNIENINANPTLFVIGQNTQTQFCSFAESSTGETLSISGLWPQDTYFIYVGDRNQNSYDFTLTINSGDNILKIKK